MARRRAVLVAAAVSILACSLVAEPPATAATVNFDGIVVLTDADGLGTGFFVAEDLVLTAEHVVAGSRGLEVRSGDETEQGEVVSADPDLDLALVRTKARGTVLELDPARPEVGTAVFAVGAAQGELSVTRGIVSGFRKVDGFEHVQTDAAINPGNSGGPLLNEDGAVLGVVVSRLRDAEGIGLVVSSAVAQEFVDGPRKAPKAATAQAGDDGGSSVEPWVVAGIAGGAVGLLGLVVLGVALVRRRARRLPRIVITEHELGDYPRPDPPRRESTDVHH